jgi:PAS domain S-box-containing protein
MWLEMPSSFDQVSLFRLLAEHTEVGIVITDAYGRTTWVNPGFQQICGYTAAELIGRKPGDVLQGEQTDPAAVERIRSALRAVRPCREELLNYHKDGHPYWVALQIVPLLDAAQAAQQFVAIEHEISISKQALAALQASEEQLRILVQNSRDLIGVLDEVGGVRYISPSTERILGYPPEELIGVNAFDLVHPDDLGNLREHFSRGLQSPGEVIRSEFRFRHRDGSWRILETNGANLLDNPAIAGMIFNGHDITERKRAEEQRLALERKLLASQKLESLGMLAGGIAHDFNNLLGIILGNAELAQLDCPADSPVREALEQIVKSTRRAAEITRQMLAYAGQGAFMALPLDLNAVLKQMAALHEASIPKQITLEYQLADNLPPIEADLHQLRQLIINLVSNAAEAIGEQSGCISIATRVWHTPNAQLSDARLAADLPEGDYVALEVSDSGAGMDAETQAKIFEPFFSTKFAGRGLGLAAVQGIVRAHRGSITVRSRMGQGTSITVMLPSVTTLAAMRPDTGPG